MNNLLQQVQALIAERLERFILPKARSLLGDGFRKLRDLPYDLCPLKLAGFEKQDRWLERVLACGEKHPPRIGPGDWKRAYAAKRAFAEKLAPRVEAIAQADVARMRGAMTAR